MSVFTNSIVLALLIGAGFVVIYHTYGRFLARRVFGFDASRPTPAYTKRDGVDYVPTHPAVLFGHHFASIAGLGPIVGPAIALVWGWGPALLWVVFGCVFLGAVHDLATLYASLRHDGRGIGDLTREIIGPRARVLFLVIIFFLLALVVGVFAIYMATLFTDMCPQAVLPSVALIFIAVLIGLLVYKQNWRLAPVTVVGLVLMFATMLWGIERPTLLYPYFLSDSARQTLVAEAGLDQATAETLYAPRPAAEHFAARADGDPGAAAAA